MLFFVSGSGHMLARGQCNTEDPNTLEFRRRALRDAVICIGWLKLFSLIGYMLLYALVHVTGKRTSISTLEIMILIAISLQVMHGTILIVGALRKNIIVLYIGLALFVLVGTYNAVLGITGAIHYIRTAHLTLHFVLIVVFLLLALSLITIVCHDIFIVYAFIRFLNKRNNPGSETVTVDPKIANAVKKGNLVPETIIKHV